MEIKNPVLNEKIIFGKNIPLLIKIFLLILLILGIFAGISLYRQNKNLSSILGQINYLSSELNNLNDKIYEQLKFSNKEDVVEKSNEENLIRTNYLNRTSLLICLVKMKENIINDTKIEDCPNLHQSIISQDLQNKFDLMNSVKNNNILYHELKENFKSISEILEKKITKENLLKLNCPDKFAEYVGKFLSWRKIDLDKIKNSEEMELTLARCEKYIENKNIILLVAELEKFEKFELIRNWNDSAKMYLRNINLIEELVKSVSEKDN